MTPPHSANGKKEVPDDNDVIEPDHYYGGGKIPVFKPTMDQFRDFQSFIGKVDHYGMRSGIIKVIPPKEWLDAQPPLDEAVKKIRVKNPIMQEFHGSHGTYTQANIERQRTYNLPQWKALCEESKPPADDVLEKTKPEGPPTPVSPESNPGDNIDSVDEEAFKNFDYRIHDQEEYTQERCEELETAYWKSLMFNNPLYGADMPGSLFDDSTTSWNVAKLPNLLDVIGQKVPGVNTAYLYLGMWKATFAWHLEDVDLYSINYIHFGAPKQWYSISQEDAPRFEQVMKSIWPSDAKSCDQFLRHKTYLVSPSILKSQYGITVNKLVHYEGEFVITYPYGYHSGFNLGYNCAESVNFATEKWLDYGRVAKKCNCEADSVWIDVDEIERKLRGEATPEYYDDFDSDMDKTSTRGRKRKHPGETTKAKRMRVNTEIPRKAPCVLCPNDLDYEDLLPTEDGKSHAHRRCALYTEETSILRDEAGKEVCTRSYHATCALLAGVQVEHGSIAVIADDGNQYSVPSVDLKCKYHRQKRPTWMTNDAADYDRKVNATAQRLVVGDLVQFQADKEINGAVVLQNRPEERTLLVKILPRG
uniref:Jumonji family transcription factor, putative n=1 Tax=Aspergillus fumigatus TaxID=746128 RepID=Q6MYP9_ASPFM|nr:jumonji family transcription factor, putative [Aspergillus fumigatus]